MVELLRLVTELATSLIPFRLVYTWQKALYFVAGRYQGTVGPGLKVVFPGLCDVKCVSMVPEIYTTQLQSVTLRDGRVLTFSASITVRVTDAAAAYLTLGHYTETVVELASRILAEELADADPERFDPSRGKRGRLMEELRSELNKACSSHGLGIDGLGFNNFLLGVRTIRLLLDQAVMTAGNHLAP